MTENAKPPAVAGPGGALQAQAGRGFEEPGDRSEILIPRATLLQFTSPQVQDQPDKYKAGEIVNNLSGDKLPMEFIPILKYTEWFMFNPRKTDDPNYDANFGPGEVVWRTTDPNDERTKLAEFGPNGERPVATRIMNFLAFFPGAAMPLCVLGFKATSYKAGKKLYTLARYAGGDMFSKKYRLTTIKKDNEQGKFFVLDVDPAGNTTPEEFATCENLWKEFHDKTKDIKTADESPEPGADGGDQGAKPY